MLRQNLDICMCGKHGSIIDRCQMYLDEELTDSEAFKFESHVHQCNPCARAFDRERRFHVFIEQAVCLSAPASFATKMKNLLTVKVDQKRI